MASPPMSSLHALSHDITNGFDLYVKDEETVTDGRTPASLVKFATAHILYTTKGPAGEDVLESETATLTAAHISAASGSGIGLLDGDTATWDEWLYMLLHASDNAVGEMIADVIGDEIDGGGRTTFIAEMNALATTLGMTGTTFTSPSGFPASTDRTTARDMVVLASAFWSLNGGDARKYTAQSLYTFTIASGPSAGTIGPWNSPVDLMTDGEPGLASGAAGVKDAGLLAAKGGFHTGTAPDSYNVLSLWQSPAGHEVVSVTLYAVTDGNRYLDHRAMLYQMTQDFPYLDAAVGTDDDIASVVLLTGFEGEVVDEVGGHTLTAETGATVNTTGPLVGTGDLALNGSTGYVHSADDPDWDMGAGDFTAECWVRGDGSEPGDDEAFIAHFDSGANQRAWDLQFDPTGNWVYSLISLAGNDFNDDAHFDMDLHGNMSAAVFFNGAKRHIMVTRSGGEVAIYVNGHRSESVFAIGGDAIHNSTARLTIGARDASGGIILPFGGNIDEVRITKGVDRTGGAEKVPIDGRAFPRS